ncbi:MAG: lysogenization regulator HflD [Oceanospirillales bacterium]|uniref:High frequency lysogenization protein HflD homolog n=1 Tax=Marinobacterium halophilum TaxID=267374 RepID=A0A2P8EU82_9GAMM|nr:lysogenization regulator HflD [Marinobacterium halophilum]MBR9829700.1 lysogenization regulator HflD [Oceanospirillales bacterium]PSL13031.1 high frequency lysogenization protein [Marinobacterium halophilum]
MSRQHDEQTIALAGMFQAASLVDQIAQRGMVPQNNYETCIASLFATNPKITEDVYGGVKDIPYGLSLGLRHLQDMVEKKEDARNKQIVQYVLGMIMLERQLNKNPDVMAKVGAGIDAIARKAHYFSEHDENSNAPLAPVAYTHTNVVAALDNLYQETISQFSFRIQIGGDPRHLQNTENAARIRALLLAGIRATLLWRQVGGKRWHMLFFRSRLKPSLHRIMRG